MLPVHLINQDSHKGLKRITTRYTYSISGVISEVKSQETLGSPVARLPVPAQDRVTELPNVVMVEGLGSSVNVMFGSAECLAVINSD